jgi:hypothetical protein
MAVRSPARSARKTLRWMPPTSRKFLEMESPRQRRQLSLALRYGRDRANLTMMRKIHVLPGVGKGRKMRRRVLGRAETEMKKIAMKGAPVPGDKDRQMRKMALVWAARRRTKENLIGKPSRILLVETRTMKKTGRRVGVIGTKTRSGPALSVEGGMTTRTIRAGRAEETATMTRMMIDPTDAVSVRHVATRARRLR